MTERADQARFKFVACPSPSHPDTARPRPVTGAVLVQVGIPAWVQEPSIARAHFMKGSAKAAIEVPQSRPRIR